MSTETTRVPTSVDANRTGWSLETAIDYVLAVVSEKDEHIRTLIAGNDKRYEQRFDASQKALELGLSGQKEMVITAMAAAGTAVSKAELATEKRFESVNEFRGTLDNQQRTLIPRSEVGVMVQGLEEKITQLTKSLDAIQARARERDSEHKGVRGGWGYAVGVVGFVMLLASLGAMLARVLP